MYLERRSEGLILEEPVVRGRTKKGELERSNQQSLKSKMVGSGEPRKDNE